MKTKISEISEIIKNLNIIDGDYKSLDLDDLFHWTTKTKARYETIEKRINKIGKKTKAFTIYAWCDVSGFNYWVKKQKESNYIQISISLHKNELTEKEIESLKSALEDAICDASNIQYECENDLLDLYNKESEGA